MKTKLLFLFAIASSVAFAQNNCETALEVEAGDYTALELSGELPDVLCDTGGDPTAAAWYKYTSPQELDITVSSSFIQNIDVDTRLNIYSGDCESLLCLANADDEGLGNTSIVTVHLLPGQSMYIVWDNSWDSEGFDFKIEEEEYVAPPLSFTPVAITDGGSNLAIVDMNGDFLDDLVQVSSSTGLHITYQEEDGTLTPVAIPNTVSNYYPSWSLAAGDLDGNGYNDLMYGNGSGVSFMFANEDGTEYTETYTTEYVFSQRGNFVDINNDGILDAYMCHDVAPSVYYISDGEGGLTFNQGGLGDYPSGGHYGSIWVDYDNDNDQDMFIAKCGGELARHINQMHRNDGEGNFEEVAEEIGLDDPMQTWSSAWGDFDNDGDLDVMVGASSFADGSHKLMENDGEGNFTDVTEGSGIDVIGSTSIENVTHDFNNDGYLDIMGMGTWMTNNGDMTFSQISVSGTGVGSVGDMNNDGFLDVSGYNSLYINDGNNNNWLKFNTIGTASNLNGIGAMVRVYTEEGVQTRQVRSGDGFRYMSTINLHFGMGSQFEVDSVTVHWPSGAMDTYLDVEINTTTQLTEGSSPTAVDDVELVDFLVFPNPTTDKVMLDVPFAYQNISYSLFDISGKKVAQGNVVSAQINLSDLENGAYVLHVNIDGKEAHRTIIKE